MIQQALERISAVFPLKKRDAGEFSSFKAGPLSVSLDWYEAEGLGNVSVLGGKAMAGLMKMDTLVIQPTGRDVPLFSFDHIAAAGRHTLLIEYYDTLIDKEEFDSAPLEAVKTSCGHIPDHDPGEHWYDGMKLASSIAKKAKKTFCPDMERAFMDATDAYIGIAGRKPALDAQASREKLKLAQEYVDGLLEKGGPSTDAFVKSLGREKTREIFTRIIFGTQK